MIEQDIHKQAYGRSPESDQGEVYSEVVGGFEEVARLATSDSAGMDDVLRLVGRRLCELLGVSRCSVYLRRGDGRFQGQIGYCVGREGIDEGVSRLVAGVGHDYFTAEIVRTLAPVLVRNAGHDPRTIQRTMRQWGVRDILGVPLVADGEVIGIIYVDNQGEDHEYTERDIQQAKVFAGLSSLAVRQAWLYRQLGDRANAISEQRRVLGESASIHNRVTRAVLDGKSITEILGLITDTLGKPVVLYGPDFQVVSWSVPRSLGQKRCPAITPEQAQMPLVQRALADLRGGRSSVMLRATPQWRCRRLLVRLVVDDQCVGYLELCELGRSFSAIDSKALEQAAMALTLKLLAAQRSAELHGQQREEYFADVLYGRRDLGFLLSRAAGFGVDTMKRHVVLRLQYDHEPDDDTAGALKRRRAAIALVSAELRADGPCVAGIGVPGADLLLLEVPATETMAANGPFTARLARVFAIATEQLDVKFLVAANPCPLSGLPAAAEKAREIAGLLQETSGSPRLVLARDLELIRLITSREGIEGARRYAEECLRPLAEHDQANGGALLETIRSFVSCQAQIRPTAAALSVHENTVRYRLARIREISSIEPERLDALLSVSVALQVEALCGKASE